MRKKEVNYKLMSHVEVEQAPIECCFSYASPLLSLGSCFSEAIGRRLNSIGYDIAINPFGTLYNPLSISKGLELMMDDLFLFGEEDITQVGNSYVSLMHHSKYSSPSPTELLERINQELLLGRKYLRKSSHILLTLGSSFVYRERQSGKVVANCHRLPPSQFDCELASLDLLQEHFSKAIRKLLTINPDATVLLTVSPIRYLGYGPHNSQLSKARLHLLIEQLVATYPSHLFYFPAYEIQLDELRDYRFYAEDLVHPSPLAEEIIFDRFIDSWANPSEKEIRLLMRKLQTMLNHKPSTQEAFFLHKKQIEQWVASHKKAFPDTLLQRIDQFIDFRFSL